ncbi:hypothetical protein CYMTET_38932 [Cymbomonas tetramitiformis]|uniref:Uncharacterized protein n=1 Tax=Cymbomonas tetramitiformis TaxID=36881 RepID=A0AAE0F556_9CHLO|nr:hypothetical protein CYMTET_38932 [Cymbomonas tetramitiformis]|eukprot:gene29382-36592_t
MSPKTNKGRSPDEPVTIHDLPEDKRSGSDRQLVRVLHKKAVELGAFTYIDPATGYSVFTSLSLEQRPCCGNRCRHCPYGHENVPKRGAPEW